MRYRGGGVGHIGTRHCNETLLADEHAPSEEVPDTGEPLVEVAENQDLESNGEDDEPMPLEGDQGASETPADLEEDQRSDFEGEGENEEDDDYELILAASTDLDIVAAAGFAAL
jgi:hypothetical protein